LDSLSRDAITLRMLLAGESVKLDSGVAAGVEAEDGDLDGAEAAFEGGGRVFG